MAFKFCFNRRNVLRMLAGTSENQCFRFDKNATGYWSHRWSDLACGVRVWMHSMCSVAVAGEKTGLSKFRQKSPLPRIS